MERKQIAHTHWLSYLRSFIIIFLGLIGFLRATQMTDLAKLFGIVISGIFIFNGVISLLKIHSRKIIVDESFITIKKGLFAIDTIEIPIENLKEIHMYQTYLEKQLDAGTITISTGEMVYRYMVNKPEALKNFLKNNKSRKR